MRNLLEQVRSVMRLAQAVSDAISVVERALLKERPSKPKVVEVGKITDGHLMYQHYNGHWPPNSAALVQFMEDMGFDDEE